MKKTKAEAEITVQKLIKTARGRFTEQGYHMIALEELVEEAGVTRGALYHHFKNKQGLFRVVFETIQKEMAEAVETEAAKSEDVWEQLMSGCRAFVASAVKPENRRIILIDGPAVLGWDVWREMDEAHSMQLLREQLLGMQQAGHLETVSVDALTHLLSGAMNEAALWLAQYPDDNGRMEEAMTVLSHAVFAFKKTV